MFNLLIFFTSLFINFNAIDLPVVLNLSDFEYIEDIKQQALYSNDPVLVFWGDSLSNINTCVIKSYYQDIYTIYFDYSSYNSSVSSSVSGGSLSNGNVWGQNTCCLDIGWTNYYRFNFSPGSGISSSGSLYTGWTNAIIPFGYPYTGRNDIIYGLNFDLYSGVNLVYSGEYVTVPVIDGSDLLGLGSLSGTGHSSGSSPFDELNQNGVNWSGNVSGYTLSGHSYSNITPVQVDTSSKEQNLLQQIINNTGHTLENSGKIGESLNNINSNIIQSTSALYNAISGFNENFVSSYIYDQEKIDDTISNSSFYAFASSSSDFANTLIDKKDSIIDMVENMQDISDFVLYIDLRNWSSPVYSDSSGNNVSFVKPFNQLVALDFSFLQETKSLWQPLLLGLLYFGLFMSIYFDLPNILKGANR